MCMWGVRPARVESERCVHPWTSTMPLGAVFEFLLQPVAEAILQIAGYVTARVLVPVATLGRVQVETFAKSPVKPGKGRIRRLPDGRLWMEAELASLVGLLFWAGVAVAVYFILRAA